MRSPASAATRIDVLLPHLCYSTNRRVSTACYRIPGAWRKDGAPIVHMPRRLRPSPLVHLVATEHLGVNWTSRSMSRRVAQQTCTCIPPRSADRGVCAFPADRAVGGGVRAVIDRGVHLAPPNVTSGRGIARRECRQSEERTRSRRRSVAEECWTGSGACGSRAVWPRASCCSEPGGVGPDARMRTTRQECVGRQQVWVA